MFNSLWPNRLQHARLPCLLPSPRACSNSCLFIQWCNPTISSSVIPFPSCLQSFQASGSFLMNWLLTSGGQSVKASASPSVLPMNIQGWFPLGLTGVIALLSKELSSIFSSITVRKHQSLLKTYQLLPKRIKNLLCPQPHFRSLSPLFPLFLSRRPFGS